MAASKPAGKKATVDHRKAVRHLKKADPVLAAVIEKVGPCRLVPNDDGKHFDHVVRSIIYQQLSGKAAGTIHARFKQLYGGRSPTPQEILATSDETIRSAGISRQKLGYLRDLAAKVVAGEVLIETIHELEDEAAIEAMTRIKGVGRWTVQMFLMFRLGRPDVMPVVDLGINKAVQKAYKLRQMPKPKKVLALAEAWRPYRTIACWYLWRSLE